MWQPRALALAQHNGCQGKSLLGAFPLTLPAGSPVCSAFCCAGGGADAAPDHHPLPKQGEAGGVLRQQGGARKGACVVNRTRQSVVACTRRRWRSCSSQQGGPGEGAPIAAGVCPWLIVWRDCRLACCTACPPHILHSLPPLPCRLPQSILQQEAKHAGFRSEVLKSQELQARI